MINAIYNNLLSEQGCPDFKCKQSSQSNGFLYMLFAADCYSLYASMYLKIQNYCLKHLLKVKFK